MIVIKLPRMSNFTSRKKEVSPYMNFYEWLASQLPHNEVTKVLYDDTGPFGCPKGYTLNVTKISICEEDYKKLSKKVKSWLKHYSEKKYYKNMYKAEYVNRELELVFAWHDLEIGPKVYREEDKSNHIIPGYVYIEDDYLTEDTRNG